MLGIIKVMRVEIYRHYFLLDTMLYVSEIYMVLKRNGGRPLLFQYQFYTKAEEKNNIVR